MSKKITTMLEAMKKLNRQERFMACVYAMNTLLISKGVYDSEEFDSLFIQWADRFGGQIK